MNECRTRITCAVLLGLSVALASEGQTLPPKTELFIVLDQETCKDVADVYVAYNGRDSAFLARREPPDSCNWKWTTMEPLNPDITPFSLRLGGMGRTTCRRAEARDIRHLEVTFTRRGTGPVVKEMKIEGPNVAYLRDVEVIDEEDISCGEGKRIPGTLFDVQFDVEDLRLQVFEEKKAACSVIVNAIPSLAKAREWATITIGPKQLAPAAVKQALETRLCFAPTFMPVEAIEESLSQPKRSFQITVTKAPPKVK